MLTDMALAAGFDSLAQVTNHARRHGGEIMRVISRALLAISVEYEELLQKGGKTAAWMLEKMDNFDSLEPTGQLPVRFFRSSSDVNLRISGLVSSPEQRGMELTAQEAYLQLIKHKSYDDMRPILQAQQQEGEFVVADIPDVDSSDHTRSA